MGDSQQPKPANVPLEVPDLEVEALPRSLPVRTLRSAAHSSSTSAAQAPNQFDDDAFMNPGLSLELASDPLKPESRQLGSGLASSDCLELLSNEYPNLTVDNAAISRSNPAVAADAWPTGLTPERAQLSIDPVELALLSGYGQAPSNPLLTPRYACRVFLRQRELKSTLARLEAEFSGSQLAHEDALAELGRALRPEAAHTERLKRTLEPLLELEQLSATRGEALSTTSAEQQQQAHALVDELRVLDEQLELARSAERAAELAYQTQHELTRRAEAKLKRVLIEIRAVTQVAERKLGPRGGQVPEPEASALSALREQASANEAPAHAARSSLVALKEALDQAGSRISQLEKSRMLASRKQQALAARFEQELELRGRSLNETCAKERAALADLARAVLALRGAVAVPEVLLARVRSTGQHVSALALRTEQQLRALNAYDRARTAQGLKLSATLAVAIIALLTLKILL